MPGLLDALKHNSTCWTRDTGQWRLQPSCHCYRMRVALLGVIEFHLDGRIGPEILNHVLVELGAQQPDADTDPLRFWRHAARISSSLRDEGVCTHPSRECPCQCRAYALGLAAALEAMLDDLAPAHVLYAITTGHERGLRWHDEDRDRRAKEEERRIEAERTARTVACPTCSAAPGKPCHAVISGRQAGDAHVSRRRAYEHTLRNDDRV